MNAESLRWTVEAVAEVTPPRESDYGRSAMCGHIAIRSASRAAVVAGMVAQGRDEVVRGEGVGCRRVVPT